MGTPHISFLSLRKKNNTKQYLKSVMLTWLKTGVKSLPKTSCISIFHSSGIWYGVAGHPVVNTLYLWGSVFKCQPGEQMPWGLSWPSSVPQGRCWHSTSKLPSSPLLNKVNFLCMISQVLVTSEASNLMTEDVTLCEHIHQWLQNGEVVLEGENQLSDTVSATNFSPSFRIHHEVQSGMSWTNSAVSATSLTYHSITLTQKCRINDKQCCIHHCV